jgi:hypothetical protein
MKKALRHRGTEAQRGVKGNGNVIPAEQIARLIICGRESLGD